MNALTSTSTAVPASGSFDPSIVARAWAHGWAISRSTAAPIERAGCFEIHVGNPDQVTRYVFPQLDREVLRQIVATEAGPGAWLKICAPREHVTGLLSGDWTVHEPEFLMSIPLAGGADPVIAGYRAQTERRGALAMVTIVAESGELAASGQAAIDGGFATFDQIVTVEAHRRKGLGRLVMSALSNAARDAGARQGVLVATEAGAALYQALGWSMVSPVTAASCSSAAPAA